MNLLDWLLDTSMGPPGPAGHWPPWLSILFHAANLAIALGYLGVPLIILHEWKYRRDGISGVRLWLVLAFLPATALSRGARVLELGGPPYHLTTLLDVLDAVAVVVAVVYLRAKVRHVLALPSRAEHHKLISELQFQVAERRSDAIEIRAMYAALAKEAESLREVLRNHLWIHDKQEALDRLDTITRLLREG